MSSIGIADKVTLDAIKALLGLNTDAAGTSTVFARLAQIAGYTDQVEGYVDTLENSLAAGIKWGRTLYRGYTSISASGYQNVVNISGPGTLGHVEISTGSSMASGSAGIKVVLDGNVIFEYGALGANNYGSIQLLQKYFTDGKFTLANVQEPCWNNLDFASSLLIQAHGDGTNAIQVWYAYNK